MSAGKEPPRDVVSSVRDQQTVRPDGGRAHPPRIEGVEVLEIGGVLTRSGWMMEVFRDDWPGHDIKVRQVNYVELSPGGTTDWHRHARQIDRLIGVGGVVRLALYDGRSDSATLGVSEVLRLGAIRPLIVCVPPGVWHALKNDSGLPAAYLGVFDQTYDHEAPDNYRPAGGELPELL